MRNVVIMFLSFIFFSISFSQSIDSGNKVYKKVEIIDSDENTITFRFENQIFKIDKSDAELDDIAKQQLFLLERNKTPDDPCNDKVLKRLEAKDSLSADEMRAYVELKKLCEDSKQKSRLLDQTSSVSSSISTTLIISSILGIAALIVVLTL